MTDKKPFKPHTKILTTEPELVADRESLEEQIHSMMGPETLVPGFSLPNKDGKDFITPHDTEELGVDLREHSIFLPCTKSNNRIRKGYVSGLNWKGNAGFNGFNTLVNVAEKFPDQIPKVISDVLPHVSRFDLSEKSSPSEFLKDYFGEVPSPEYRHYLNEQWDEFFFPHEYVAIQDNCGCVILFDLESMKGKSEDKPLREGLTGRKIGFIDVSPVRIEALDGSADESLNFLEHVNNDISDHTKDNSLASITFGVVTDGGDRPGQGKFLEMHIKKACMAGKKGVVATQDQMVKHFFQIKKAHTKSLGFGSDSDEITSVQPAPVPSYAWTLKGNTAFCFATCVCNNVMTAIEEVFFINDPRNFRFEVTHQKAIERFLKRFNKFKNKKKKKLQLPRFDEAPCDTVMTPSEFFEYTNYSPPPSTGGEDKTKRRGHCRRAHMAYLKHARFGTPRWIKKKACWCGPKEATVRGKTYRVRTEEDRVAKRKT